MKQLWGILLVPMMMGSVSPRSTPESTSPCDLQGAVYVISVASFADHRVFIQEVEAFADLVVYKEEAELYADRPGHWYLTDTQSAADFTIYLEDVEAFADFSIAYTPFRTAAGCSR